MQSIRQSTQQMLEEQYREAAKHEPDCSDVTDQQLQQAIVARWPVTDGVARIPYGFSSRPLWGNFVLNARFLAFGPEDAHGELEAIMKTTLRFALDQIETASRGAIEFIEDENVQLFSRGIFFTLAGDSDHFSAYWQDNRFAFATRRIDNNDELKQAVIFLPNNIEYWRNTAKLPFPMLAWIHEIMHAIGFNHLHEFLDMRAALRSIPEGLFCSVMPYVDEIATTISKCITNCNTPFTMYPGVLDENLLRLAYVNGVVATESNVRNGNYIINIWEMTLLSLCISLLHQNTAAFFSKVTLYSDKPIFSEKSAKILADLGFLATIISLELPTGLIGLFAVTALAKHFPKLEKLPPAVKTLLENLNVPSFNLGLAYMQGQKTVPLFFTSLFSLLATGIGAQSDCLGRWTAKLTNWKSQTAKQNDVPAPVLTGIVVDQDKTIAAGLNPHILFHYRKKQSLCTRFTNWITGHKATAQESENTHLLASTAAKRPRV